MSKKQMSTFDAFMEDDRQRELFNKEYRKFELSEFLLQAMEENHISVRKLSEKSGISTSIIQNIRSEKTKNVTLQTVQALASTLGYELHFEKAESRA